MTNHPFADLLGLTIVEKNNGVCEAKIEFDSKLQNPNGVVHGGVLYSLVDTCMGGALQSSLLEAELCATIEIKITYLHAVYQSNLTCKAELIKKGRRVAMLESQVLADGKIVARASGSFALFSS